MTRKYTPTQRARLYQCQRKWYHQNKDWVNPKRYANLLLKMAADPEYAERRRVQNREAQMRHRAKRQMLEAA